MFDLRKYPNNPGCYLFKDKKDKILYVGKAKNLKKRLASYKNNNKIDNKTKAMLSNAYSIDFMVTDNEMESLILENTLIKRYQPKYNIRLKDAKSHSYILLTDERYPRVVLSRTKTRKGRYYGPFINAHERDYVLHFLRRTFRTRTCKRLPKKPCLRYHIDLCDAPCINNISEEEYNQKINKIKMVLNGKTSQLIKNMDSEMKKKVENQDFEKAILLREEIKAMENLNEHQKMLREKRYNEDIINFQIKSDIVYLMVFNIYKGTLSNKKSYSFDYNDDFLEEFIIQYYHEYPIPKELIIPKEISESIKFFLEDIKGSKVKITVPKRGDKKKLLLLVDKNIDITFFSNLDKVETLKKRLELNVRPSIIECFDISHLSGTSTVGSMVQFREGKPDKNNYRRFKIRTVKGIDDTASISEVVGRRYKRLVNEQSELPDLIIIDGGKGQLNAALKQLKALDLKIPIISIAKQFEEIYFPELEKPLRLPEKDKALHFIQEIRNEAHRFAIKYNRLLRKKELVG